MKFTTQEIEYLEDLEYKKVIESQYIQYDIYNGNIVVLKNDAGLFTVSDDEITRTKLTWEEVKKLIGEED